MDRSNIRPFGTTVCGEDVFSITLKNNDITCEILTYGATIRTLFVPDRNGSAVDVVLGYDTLQEYERQDGYFGATIGRFSNRIANSRFVLNGKQYILAANDGKNHLHGGNTGFSHRIWKIETCSNCEACLSLLSANGDEGYPGNLYSSITYSLKNKSLFMCYHAVSDKDTICSLTNHSYFNLAGHNTGPVYCQEIQLRASQFTPSNSQTIPIGTVAAVANTPMDLLHHTRIGQFLNSDFSQIKQFGGYDHNYVIDGQPGILRPAANVRCASTGIVMQLDTTFPGVQFYTGNALKEERQGKSGSIYGTHHGFCLETQFYPDSPNHPNFPSACLKAGDHFAQTTVFSFYAM